MAKAFVETTVLVDALLKSDDSSRAARQAIRRYDQVELPVYAIKEFRDGPLRNFVWFHNKLVTTRSFANAIGALQRMSLTPRRYTTATALEALRDAARKVGSVTAAQMVKEYGPAAKMDAILCDRFRLSLRAAIARAWRKRRSLASEVVCPLACYDEAGPVEVSGQLVLGRLGCDGETQCSIAAELGKDMGSLREVKAVVDSLPKKRENDRRSKALRHLLRTPKRRLPADMCRHLGDAVFACLAPIDATILTTNIRDIGPLAAALGKRFEAP